jgi:hypothetical protein
MPAWCSVLVFSKVSFSARWLFDLQPRAIAMMNHRRFDMGDTAGKRPDAGHRVQANVVSGDQEENSEFTMCLANVIRELVKAGLDLEECERLAIAVTVAALVAIEEAGIEMITDPLFESWPPFPFSAN